MGKCLFSPEFYANYCYRSVRGMWAPGEVRFLVSTGNSASCDEQWTKSGCLDLQVYWQNRRKAYDPSICGLQTRGQAKVMVLIPEFCFARFCWLQPHSRRR